METDHDWKSKVGFPINYDSSDDDPDLKDVVMRYRHSDYLLEDRGDGAEADILGTTPPRQRQRENSRFKNRISLGSGIPRVETTTGRKKDVKSIRMVTRDELMRENRSESLPHTEDGQPVPTFVESCNRFMSLTSRLKCREEQCPSPPPEPDVERRGPPGDAPPASRVTFHKIFSTLINMGNVEKGCRRTISREEQVWQNELKDLIWLELQAKLAGRTLAQQDAFLCKQRKIVPTIVQNIRDYRFVNPNPCRSRARSRRLGAITGSSDDLTADQDDSRDKPNDDNDEESALGCLSFNCVSCCAAIGAAMREVRALLESFNAAHALYPSSKALTADHPLVATQLFQNRVKAMCLWYNTALHLRLKVVAVRQMLRTMKAKQQRRPFDHLASTDSDVSRQSSEYHKPSAVRFNVNSTPSDSNNSDSCHSDVKDSSDERVPSEDQGPAEDQGPSEVQGPLEDHGSSKDQAWTEGQGHPDQVQVTDIQPNGDIRSDENASSEENRGDKKISEKLDVRRVDEVDFSKSGDQTGQTTPEIIISDSKYGTADTVSSNESGYSTSMESECRQVECIYDIGSLEELTQLRLLGKCDISPYRAHHEEILKTQGIRRCMQFMNKMRQKVLHKVHLTLEKPHSESEKKTVLSEDRVDPAEVFDDTKDDEQSSDAEDEEAKRVQELRRYGCWSEESRAMRLPSYRSHLLLLSSVCMEAVHDYLDMRLGDTPSNPSCLTVKQLIHELKEGLDIATEMRADYVRNIGVVLGGARPSDNERQDLLLLLRTFDATVETVFKQYLSYLRTMSATDRMARATLQREWSFAASLARRHRQAATAAPPVFAEIACNQLERIKTQFELKFRQFEEKKKTHEVESKRQIVYAICRSAQHIYASERDATLQAATWARALAARLARAPPPAYRKERGDIFNSMMRLRDSVVLHTSEIVSRSRAVEGDNNDAVTARVRELILQAHKLGFELHKELYRFAQAPFQLVEEKNAKKRPVSLQPMRPRPMDTRRRRPETMIVHEHSNPMIHKELHKLVNESSTRGSQPAVQLRRNGSGNSPPRQSRLKFNRSESIGEDVETSVFDFDHINHFGENQTQNSIELLLSGERPSITDGQWPADNRVSEEEKEWAVRVARAVVEFARCWMRFVVERCDTGRGLRPRWASQGLEFLMLACDPCNTKHLTDAEFEELKKEMDGCISHVIGRRPPAPRAQEAAASPHSPTPPHRKRATREPLLVSGVGKSCPDEVPSPPTPPSAPDPLLNFDALQSNAHNSRILEAIKEIDEQRDRKLRESKAVGRVLDAVVASYEPKLRQLTFKWQRGLKIGAGTFGKVYTVVNTESGQLLAMKEICVAAGDRRALQRAANELRVLEGVSHPHLVRYYGCELHREEMLLFMELCVEGSLEALVVNSGALAEGTVRRYTKQLVSAVTELHSRGIAHRDIKSGNIFLTNEGHCLKLGDFGSAVKIRANTTAAGELMGYVGTQAYMAPEVFMKSSGHGRAADIWSLGCVVTEMASGKRPFSEYDSNYQIMFVVGMGGRPAIPPSLSAEGQAFCRACLTHEPDQRPRADQLSLHHFLMIKSDDDCECQTTYLKT